MGSIPGGIATKYNLTSAVTTVLGTTQFGIDHTLVWEPTWRHNCAEVIINAHHHCVHRPYQDEPQIWMSEHLVNLMTREVPTSGTVLNNNSKDIGQSPNYPILDQLD